MIGKGRPAAPGAEVPIPAADDERWAEARSLLREQPTDAVQRRMRRRRNQLLLIVAAMTVLAIGVGLIVAALVPHQHHASHDPTGWPAIVRSRCIIRAAARNAAAPVFAVGGRLPSC